MSEIYLYSHSTRSLVQKPGMEKPGNRVGEPTPIYRTAEFYKNNEAYEQHLASLKSYPCSWLDQNSDLVEQIEGWHFVVVNGKAVKIIPPDAPLEDQEAIAERQQASIDAENLKTIIKHNSRMSWFSAEGLTHQILSKYTIKRKAP